jgi:hypothetical protein
MKPFINSLSQRLKNEDGIALAVVVMMTAVLTLLGVILIDQVRSESSRAARSISSDAVYQAAEAGMNDYLAKLVENPQFYDQCVAKGESTRRRGDNSALVSHSIDTDSCSSVGASTWKAGVTWTYPNKKDWWFAGVGTDSDSSVLTGYAYNLMISPPALNRRYVTIVSTGCKVLNPAAAPLQCDLTAPRRAIEVHIKRTTPADFQFLMTDMSGSIVAWASKIYGKMYSTGDIKVDGATAWGNVMAEGYVTDRNGNSVSPPITVVSPSRIYDKRRPNIRDVVPNPITFSDLQVSLSDISRSAAQDNMVFDDATANSWRIIFGSSGNVTIWKCVTPPIAATSDALEAADSNPYCGPDVTLAANTYLKRNATTFPLTVSGNPEGFVKTSFPSSPTGLNSNFRFYVGPTGSVDRVECASRTGATFNTCTCPTCSSDKLHAAGQIVSGVSGGITWAAPFRSVPIPSKGAIYTGQTAVISWPSAINGYSADGSSIVNGRVTVASNDDIVIGGNTHYNSEPSYGNGANDDVLGLIAQNNVWLAKYTPTQLWFRASTMALLGKWGDYRCTDGGGERDSGSSMTFVGTAAYYNTGGCIHGSNGGYNISNTYRITDDGTAPECPTTAPGCTNFNALAFLFPPWFRVLGKQATVYFREVPVGYIPAEVAAP